MGTNGPQHGREWPDIPIGSWVRYDRWPGGMPHVAVFEGFDRAGTSTYLRLRRSGRVLWIIPGDFVEEISEGEAVLHVLAF